MKSDPIIPNKYWIGQKIHLGLCKMAWNNLNFLTNPIIKQLI